MKKENKKTKKTCAPDDLITYRYLDTWVFADCWGLGLFFLKNHIRDYFLDKIIPFKCRGWVGEKATVCT